MGPTCAGKSTRAEAMEHRDGVRVVSTGSIAREVMSDGQMAEDVNPLAPEAVESRIRDSVQMAIIREQTHHTNGEGVDTLVVDSMPRSRDQAIWIGDLARNNPHIEFLVCYVDIKPSERKKRMAQRAISDGHDRAGLTVARERVESGELLAALTYLMGCDEVMIATQEGDDAMVSPASLGRLFHAHRQFADLSLGKRFGTTLTDIHHRASAELTTDPLTASHPSTFWTRNFLRMARRECTEAMAEVPDEWWTDDEMDRDKVLEEIVDVLHFLFSAVMSLGFGAQQLFVAFMRKRAKNFKRQTSKYKKRQ